MKQLIFALSFLLSAGASAYQIAWILPANSQHTEIRIYQCIGTSNCSQNDTLLAVLPLGDTFFDIGTPATNRSYVLSTFNASTGIESPDSNIVVFDTANPPAGPLAPTNVTITP